MLFIIENHEWASAILIDAGLVNIKKGIITLCLPSHGFAMLQVRGDRRIMKNLSQISTDYFDEDMEIRIIDALPSIPQAPSFSMVKEREYSDAIAKVIEDAKNDVVVKKLIKTFKSKIADIEPSYIVQE